MKSLSSVVLLCNGSALKPLDGMNYFFHLAAGYEVCPGSLKESLLLKGSVPYLSVLPLCAPVPRLVLAMMRDPMVSLFTGIKQWNPFCLICFLTAESREQQPICKVRPGEAAAEGRWQTCSWQGAGELGHLVAISCQVNLAVTSVWALILVPCCLKIEQTAFNYGVLFCRNTMPSWLCFLLALPLLCRACDILEYCFNI